MFTDPPFIIVTHEERPADIVGVRLLAASLAAHDPDIPLWIYMPPALCDAESTTLQSIHPRIQILPFTTTVGWGCKPDVLRHTLDQNPPNQRILWIDSDMIATRSLRELSHLSPETIILGEECNPEPNAKMIARQQVMSLPPHHPENVTTLSSSVVGVTHHHRPILKIWQDFVESDTFADHQSRYWDQRLFPNDQEVLASTVCCETYAEVPRIVLRNFNELLNATFTNYRPDDDPPGRVTPMLVHAVGDLKPWRSTRFRFTQETFPYFAESKKYLAVVPDELRRHFRTRSLVTFLWRLTGGDFDRMTRLRRRFPGLRPKFIRLLRRLGIDRSAR